MIKLNSKKTGQCLIKEGLIKTDDIATVLSLQKKSRESTGIGRGKLFGTLLCDLKYLDPVRNYYYLHKTNKLLSLNDFLTSNDILSREMLRTVEIRSRTSKTPLLSKLLQLEMVTGSTLEKIVQELYHLPFMFISPETFEDAETQDLPFAFKREDALKKRMLPLVIRNKTVIIGITDPDNLLSVYELMKKFPRLKFKPVFILYSCFKKFFHILYGQDSKEPEPDLTLLLNSKVTISDPKTEPVSIACLYSRYELLKGLNGHGKSRERRVAFKEFIFQEHQRITRNHGCSSVDYSFRRQKSQIKLIAVPKI